MTEHFAAPITVVVQRQPRERSRRMAYVVSGSYRVVSFKSDPVRRVVAFAFAMSLLGRGFRGITITDEDGSRFGLAEFRARLLVGPERICVRHTS